MSGSSPFVIDMTGKKIGRLVFLRPKGLDAQGHMLWLVKCDCGKKKVVRGSHVRYGAVKSCGCFNGEQIHRLHYKHGGAIRGQKTREYSIWKGMKQRCLNSRVECYKHYGGRGITMCKRWKDSFANFLQDMGRCPPGLTLERINVNGNYEPGNCKWATWKEQANNTRRKQLVE